MEYVHLMQAAVSLLQHKWYFGCLAVRSFDFDFTATASGKRETQLFSELQG
jgi:hypothetical protein